MSSPLTATQFITALETYRSPEEFTKLQRFFKRELAAGDQFLGVKMGDVFALAKTFIDLPLAEIEQLLESPWHEVRVGGVSVMDWQARRKKTAESQRQALFELYLRRHDRINSWDLVDRSAIYVVGGYLFDKSRTILYTLASSANIWERRTAIVSTAYFIKQKDVADTFKIAEQLLNDEEDLIHKATGWMLRAAGGPSLLTFLDQYASTMPRTTLRYAVENLDKTQRDYYLKLKKSQ